MLITQIGRSTFSRFSMALGEYFYALITLRSTFSRRSENISMLIARIGVRFMLTQHVLEYVLWIFVLPDMAPNLNLC